MKIEFAVEGGRYSADTQSAISLAIPLRFNGPQPRAFGGRAASSRPLRIGQFVGDLRRGGSCNASEVRLSPHSNGTHTESIAHICQAGVPVYEASSVLCPATLVSLAVVPAAQTRDSYAPALNTEDQVVDQQSLRSMLDPVSSAWLEALVVRTLPNGPDKLTARYGDGPNPPFFTREAIQYLRTRQVEHLVLDLPSLDRMRDEGRLTAHHLFWDLPEGSREGATFAGSQRSVTELCFVPDTLPDGHYLLNLQVPAFELDAAPCRPLLIPVELA